MSRILQAPIKRMEIYPGGNLLLSVEASEIASECRPGQFVMASVEEGLLYPSPLLKRALAIYSVERDRGGPSDITLLVKVVGEGTARLAQARPGDRLSLVGPLGNGFEWESSRGKTHLIVAGGIGIASVLLLARDLKEQGQDVRLIYGARTGRELVGLEDFERLGVPTVTTTEDGSHGMAGLVTHGLSEVWKQVRPPSSALYVCGPNPMMQAVSALAAKRSARCQISVEVRMACGFGVCLGCSIKTLDGYRLACTHGPVFDARSFVWEPADQKPARAS